LTIHNPLNELCEISPIDYRTNATKNGENFGFILLQ
jgi:hypothetical protein